MAINYFDRLRVERMTGDISLGRLMFRLLDDLPKWRSTLALYNPPGVCKSLK